MFLDSLKVLLNGFRTLLPCLVVLLGRLRYVLFLDGLSIHMPEQVLFPQSVVPLCDGLTLLLQTTDGIVLKRFIHGLILPFLRGKKTYNAYLVFPFSRE